MGFVFFALIFLLFDITITELQVDIFFDFVGWALMFFGLQRLNSTVKSFRPLKPASALMIVISIVYVFLKAFAFSGQSGAIYAADFIYSVLKTAVLTLTLFTIFKRKNLIKDVVLLYRARNIWNIYLILWTAYLIYAAFISDSIPKTVGNAVTQVLIIATLFIQVLFLIMIYKIRMDFLAHNVQKGR